MVSKLIFAPEALQDLSDARDWYEGRRIGLGGEFMTCVETALEAIGLNPELFPKIFENYRRMIVRRFPYVVLYEYEAGLTIVYAIFHSARDPEKWRRRIT